MYIMQMILIQHFEIKNFRNKHILNLWGTINENKSPSQKQESHIRNTRFPECLLNTSYTVLNSYHTIFLDTYPN